MNKVNKFLSEHINILFCLFIILQPIIDAATGISVNFGILISPGIIVRTMFMLFMIYYLLFLQKLYRKKYVMLILIIFIYICLYSLGNSEYKDIIGLIKSFYFPIIFITLFSFYKNNNTTSDKSLLISLFIYLIIILIARITNTAFDSYDVAKIGSVGWFSSANEIGAIIAILLPFIINLIYKNFDYFKLLILILTVVISFIIGTRIPLISMCLCFIYYYFKIIKKLYLNKKNKLLTLIIIFSVLTVISFILIIPSTPIYKNIQIHSEFLKIDSVDDIFKDTKTIDHFIFSSRLSYLNNTNEVYANSSTYYKLFGIGYTKNQKMIEMDPFDIFYRHGIVGFLIYFGSIIYLISLIKIDRINKKNILPLLMIIFISLFAGHVFTSPNVSTFAVIILLNIFFANYGRCDNN